MTVDPRTALHTSDLSPEDFAILASKVVSRTGLAGPYQLTSGTIGDYANQSGKPELVWLGGTEGEPTCVWIVYPGEGGAKVKIKIPLPGDGGFCAQVIACVAADLLLQGSPDKYLIPEMDGPTWRVVSVEWIDGDEVAQSADFSLDTGTDLISLVAALNDSDNLPEGWYWEILPAVTGDLCLVVPHGTFIVKVVLEGGEEAEFNGVPSIVGGPNSTLSGNFTINQVITGNGAAVGSAHDTEAEVEAQFALMQNVTVRWTDADGDERVSYKDPINGWYHPVEKIYNPGGPSGHSGDGVVLYTTGTGSDGGNSGTFGFDSSLFPVDAKYVYAQLTVRISSGTGDAVTVDAEIIKFGETLPIVRLDAYAPGTNPSHVYVRAMAWIPVYGRQIEWDLGRSAGGSGHATTFRIALRGWKR